MIPTTKGKYAVMAMLEMAKSNGSWVNLLHISESQNIPHNYLEQIFLKLKREGIVTSTRGPGGGYKLNTFPEEISLYKIVSAVEDDIAAPKCRKNQACNSYQEKCTTHYLWEGLERKVVKYLSRISLADVMNGNVLHLTQSLYENEVTSKKIYFDYNATTPLHPYVKEEIYNILGAPTNPSSLHWYGRKAKALIENARNKIAKALGIKLGIGEYQITFTSSGTEANNLLLHNFADIQIITSSVEHLSILDSAKKHHNCISILVDKNGQIQMDYFLEAIKKAPKGSLVSIIMANNETGIIQENMQEIIKLTHEYGLLIHSDYVQSFGKIATDISGLDFATISSHKIGGPIGAAALIHKANFPMRAFISGGGQERGMRSGTENVAAIVGFGRAAELAVGNIAKYAEIKALRDKMEEMLTDTCPNTVFYGAYSLRLPNTSMIMMPGVDAQKQLIQFDLNDISVSAGSACSSGKMKTSYVLTAMGVPEKEAKCAIRVSLGSDTSLGEIEKFVETWKKIKSNRGSP